MKKVILLILFTVFTLNIQAQSPDAFKYQSVVRDAGGNVLANQATGIQVRILKTSATGSEVYKETHSVTSNAFGLINLEIGGGDNVVGDFEDIAWGSDSYFLEVAVDPAGGTSYSITGSSQLLSVPYALYAKNAGNAESLWFEDTTTPNASGISYYTGDLSKDNVAIGNVPFTTAKFASYTVAGDNQKPNIRAFSYDANGTGYIQASNNVARNLSVGVNGTTNSFGANEAYIWFDYTADLKFGVDNTERARIRTGTGNLDVTTGDIYIKDATKGVIMKSPNGSCFRMTVSDAGAPVFTSVTCPD